MLILTMDLRAGNVGDVGIVQATGTCDFMELAGKFGKLTKRSPIWGLHWSMLAVLAWAIWKETNTRRKKNNVSTPTVVLKQGIRMLKHSQIRRGTSSIRDVGCICHGDSRCRLNFD